MSNTTQYTAPLTVDSDGPAAPVQRPSDDWKLTAAPTVDGPSTAPVTSVLKAFVNYPTLVKGEGHVTEERVSADYSDGYGGTYAVGE